MDPLQSLHTSSPIKVVSSTHEFVLHDDDEGDGKDLESLTDSSLASSECSACCVNAEATLHRCEALAHENKLLHANVVIIESANEELSRRIKDLEDSRVQDQAHFDLLAEKCVTLGLEDAGQEDQIVRLSTELRNHDAEIDELSMQIVELQYSLQQEKEVRWLSSVRGISHMLAPKVFFTLSMRLFIVVSSSDSTVLIPRTAGEGETADGLPEDVPGRYHAPDDKGSSQLTENCLDGQCNI